MVLILLKLFSLPAEDSMLSSQTERVTLQVHVLSALFSWLIGILQNMKSLIDKSSVVEPQDTSEMLTPRYRIRKLLRTCLHVANPDNGQLTRSSLVLAQMTANGSLSEKLKKLLKHSSLGSICLTTSMSEHTLEQQENDILQAATEFDLVKYRKLKIQTLHEPKVADFGRDSKWGVAESWNQCVIGMLPYGLGSLNNPVSATEDFNAIKVLHSNEVLEPTPCSCKRKLIDEDPTMFQNTVSKKIKETTEDHEFDGYVHCTGGVEGLLLLDGMWKRIRDEEISAIRSLVRIMGR